MDWRAIILDSLIVAIIGAGGAVVAALITNMITGFGSSHGLKRRMGDPGNETLAGQHEQLKSHLTNIQKALKEETTPALQGVEATTTKTASQVNELMDELHFQQRVKKDISVGRDYNMILLGIEKLYEENTALHGQVVRLTRERNELLQKNEQLMRTVAAYEKCDPTLEMER